MLAIFAQSGAADSSNLAAKSDQLKASASGVVNWVSDHAIEILFAVAAGFILYLGMVTIKGLLSRLHNPENSEQSVISLIGLYFFRTTLLFIVAPAI